MQLLEAEFTNFCQIEYLLVQFNPAGRCHLIRGRNNAGKSNMLRGICFAFDLTRGASAFGSSSSINRRNKSEKLIVRVKFSEGENIHEIKRTITKKKGGNIVEMDGVAVPLTEAARIFQEDWGCVHPEQLLALLILPQGRTDLLVRESGAVREERLGRMKGLHRIKAKVAELEKQRKALKAQREALAAEGIVATEKEASLEQLGREIETLNGQIDIVAKKLISDAEKAALLGAQLWHQRTIAQKAADGLIAKLPAWTENWMAEFKKGVATGKVVTADEMARRITEAIQTAAQNTTILKQQASLQVHISRIPLKDKSQWHLLGAADRAESAYKDAETKLKLDAQTLPTAEDIKAWDTLAEQLTLVGYVEEIRSQLGAGGNGPLPFEDTVQNLHAAFERYGMPTVCPVSDQPITKEGIASAKNKAKERRAAGEKNAAVTSFLKQAKAIPSLAPLATVAKLSELIATVDKAKAELTAERQNWRKRRNDVQTLRAAHQRWVAAQNEAVHALAAWATMSAEEKQQLLIRIEKAETIQTTLTSLGPEKVVISERFDNPAQEELLCTLEDHLRNIHNLTKQITDEKTAAATAATKSATDIATILQNQMTEEKQHANLTGVLTTKLKNQTDLTTEIANIKRRKEEHDLKKEEEDAYSEASDFLQPGNGPREIIRLDLQDALAETNERLADMGVDLMLECDEQLQIFAGTIEEMADTETRTEGELLGMGLGALAGAFLHAALLRQFNESVSVGKIENLILDEPTAFLRPHIKPGFYQSLTTGPLKVSGLVMVEHEPQAVSFASGTTSFGEDQ